ncbi:hypothetical protein [Sinomonas sp. B1-1]|uniref:hypothetical protein n=1 Tax=Sinomonas sp. B1-1 TaxID=3141454 RepID=UPI003D2869DF
MTTLTRNWLGRAAAVAGLAALGVFVAVFFVAAEATRAWVYTAGFLVALGAVVLAAAARLREHRERPTLRPLTRLGWWAVGLAAGGAVLLVGGPLLMRLFVAATETGFVPASPALLALGAMLAAGIVAATAWFRRAERSLLVLLTIVPALFALYFMVGEFVFPH